jgi:asparagine synthase (glutamine-hydrolysing)
MMITSIKLTRNKVFRWYCREHVHTKGYLFAPDGTLYRDADLYNYFSNITSVDDFRQKLLSANGIFSVIIQKNKSVWVAVDRFRKFPLFYRNQKATWIISDDVDNLFEADEQKEIDTEAYLTFSGCGYVLGNKTLLKGVFQLQAGEFLVYDEIRMMPSFYHQHFSPIQDISFDEARTQLKKIFLNVAQRMSRLIGDRPVIVSLSGGFDSRMLAYLLKKTGKTNVLCFTYGIKEGNPEWERSKAVAEKLGFKWVFIDYSTMDEPSFHKEKQFIDFYTYVAQYVSKFGFASYFAVNYLIHTLSISSDSVMLTGDGGDFFAGGHLRPYMAKYQSLSTIAQDLQYMHCNLVELHQAKRKKIRSIIKQKLRNTTPLFSNIENWDLKERQAKYIFNSDKLWEYFKIEPQTPLCDTALMDFFVSLPFEYRLNQKLYKTVLTELFEECELNFPQDVNKQEKAIIQQCKIYIKRIFPFLKKKPDLFQYDYFDFKRFVQPILQELHTEKQDEKIISSNGIFSEWYLIQVKKEISDSLNHFQ